MKKYPIFYQDQEYEVRWKRDLYIDHLIIYRVYKIFGIKFFEKVYQMDEFDINFEIIHENNLKGIHSSLKETPEYRIEQVKCLFKNMEKDLSKIKKEREQEQTLAEWGGVIDAD